MNYGEFVAVTVHLRKMANDEHLHKAFAYFDRNESGYIEIEDLREALCDDNDANSEEVVIAIMHDVDTDKVSNICTPLRLYFLKNCDSILVSFVLLKKKVYLAELKLNAKMTMKKKEV